MATPSKNRWELEEKRKKQAQQQALAAAQNAIKSGAAFKGNAVTSTINNAAAANTTQKTSNAAPKANTVTVSKPQGANIPTFLQGSGRVASQTASAPKQKIGLSSLKTLAEMPQTIQSVGNRVLQTSNDMRNLQRNSLLWHGTTDTNERARLKSENDVIRKRLGLSYDKGNTYNPRTGQNLSTLTDQLYGNLYGQRANAAAQYAADTIPTLARQLAESNPVEDKSLGERVLDTIEASTKRVRAGLDNWFATGNIAADEEAEQKFLAGEELGWLDQLRMKERWGENWESYLSGVRDAYQTGNTEIIEDYEQRARALNNLYDTTPLFDEAAQQAEAAKAGLGTAGRTALDAIGMGADMLGAASIASTGGGGAGLFTGVASVSAAGQAADQARRMGASAAQQEDYGNAVGALNFAVERLGGIGGGQAASKIANRILPEAVKNAAGKVTSTAVGRVLAGGAEEGLEGALQSEGERALRNAILDANEKFDPATFGANTGYSALMGSIFRGGQEASGAIRNKVMSTSAAQQTVNTQAIRDRMAEIASTQDADVGTRMAQEAMQTALGETLLPRQGIVQEGSRPRGIESNPYMGMPVEMLQNRLAQLQQQYWSADAETQQAMLEDMSRLTEAIDSQGITTTAEKQEANTQALGARMAELDAEMRTAESLLPGPARDARIAEVRAEMERVQAEAAIQEGLREPEPLQAENADVPVSEAIQYGATPQQAMNEAKVKEAGRIRQGLREAHRNIVSGQAEIERFARAQDRTNPKAVNANDLAQINRAANSTVDTIAGTALVDRKGDKIGDSWVDVVGDLTPEQIEQLTLYRLHKHNIDRMSLFERTQDARTEAAMEYDAFLNENPAFKSMTEQSVEDWRRNGTPGEQALAEEYITLKERLNALQGIHNKPVIAKVSDDGTRDEPYTADESANIVREMEAQNPKLKEWAEKAEQFHDEFMQEWAVGSGLMSQEQYDMLKERYPHYVQTYRMRDNWGGGADTTRRGTVNTGSPIKEAVGDLSEIIPFEDAEMMQVNTIVKNARRNELFRNIYDFAKANQAAAAPYVRVVGEDAEYQAPESIDDLTGRISDAAMSDAGGTYTIRAMVDGKPVTMQVNSAFYAGLQNLFRQDRGASDTFMKRVVGPVTTGFKRVTTGDNPFFAATNLAKDAQTAYFNTISRRKLAVTYMYDAVRSAVHMAQNADDWKTFSALGGKSSTFYDNNKGFEKSLEISKRNKKGIRKALNTVHGWVTFLNENAEAVWRFNEYRAGIERYGDTPEGRMKAIQAAADVTTNFSRSGPAAKSFDTFVPYLNASIQGLDKTARQIKNHPFTTTRRALELITLPTLVLWMINKDDEDYQDLNNRTKDNYFCVPATAFDFIAKPLGLETEGKFIKIPKSREYGVAFGAAFERALRAWVQGEDIATAFKGLGSQLMTNLAPSNPVTDNIFKNIFIDLPTNRDFAGRAIVPERMQGLSPENQYDYSTSGAGMAIASAWNKTAGNMFGKISPMQVDYLLDSNLGFVGDAIIGATTNPKSISETIDQIKADPKTVFLPIFNTMEQKFVADPMYQSGVTDAFYEELDAAEKAKNDKNLTENIAADVITPEEKYYSELSKASGEISELRKQERELLADRSLTDEQREEQVREIRRQINEIAKAAPGNAQRVRDEYAKTYIPEISYLEGDRHEQALEAISHGVTPQQFAETDKRLKELTNEKGTDDKKVRTAAEARSMVLDEVLQNSALSDSEKEAIADYVIISSIGEEDEKTRQNWENIAKGKVNASDFVRFQADASIYDDWAEGTGTDNAANVAKILRGYEGLTDEQRDVLFQTYRDNMSVNPFHVSVYEKAIDSNGSFFSALTDDGKARLRSLLNEYEQDINQGAELDEWRAKAYMAEKEAGIAPGIYAMYRVALETANTDGKGNPRQSEAEACVNAMDGLTQYQKAYLYASTNSSWKNNPFGNATVGEYSSGLEIGINPIEGGMVTSGFGPRDSFQTDNGAMSSSNHPSIDIGATEGTPIGAYKSGKVTKNGWVDGYGWTIEVTHSDGTVSAYHHMMEQSPVSVGTEVTQGDQIGKVGQTGNSKGAHLDLTITRDGKPIDPASLIPELKDSATGYVWTGSNVYTNVTSGSGQSSGSGGGKSSSLKNLKTIKQGLGGLDSLF